MTKDQRIDQAIELVNQADDILGQAKRMLYGCNQQLAIEHMVDAQFQLDDATTHMQTRPLSRKSKKVLTKRLARV